MRFVSTPTQWMSSCGFLCGGIVLLVLGIVALTVPAAYAQTGPGGVGNASGADAQPINTLWLDASDLNLSDGDPVTTWPDASGNDNDAVEETTDPDIAPPVFSSAGTNGRPVLRFNPTPSEKPLLVLSNRIGATDGTIFIVANKDATDTASGYRTLFTTDNHVLVGEAADNEDGTVSPTGLEDANEWGGFYSPPTKTHGSNVELGPTYRLLTHVVRGNGAGAYDSDESYTNGGNRQSFTQGTFSSNPSNVIGGGNNLRQNHKGNIAEVLHFGTDLNAAQRTIVNSYLANKYGLPTGNAEVRPYAYTGAYFDDFAGLGQVSGEAHVDAQSAQLRLRDPQGLADGDILLFGHDGAGASAYTTGELPSGIDERIRREWRVDERAGDIGAVTVQIDASDLPSITSGQDYFVVIDGDSDGDFTTGTPTTARLTPQSGSIYTASGVDLADGDYVTLGVGARPETPANLTAESDLNRRVLLDWDAVTLDRTGQSTTLDEYRVYQSTTNSFSSATQVAATTPSTTDAEITGLTNNTPYFFWITAVDEIGESDLQSPAVDATPALKISFASSSSNGSEPGDANGFTVELSDANNQNVDATLSISALGGSLRSVSGVTSIDNGGSGYAVGDVIEEDDSGDGGTDLQIEVTNVDGSGAVTGADVVNGGSGYTRAPTSFTTLSGSGSGASFSLDLQAAGSDFTLKTTTVSVSSNNLTRTLGSGDLEFDNDNIPENTETVVLQLSSPQTTSGAAPVVGAQATHEVTIQDDDFDRNVFLVDTFGSNTDGATSEQEGAAATYTVKTDDPDLVNDTEINYVVDLNAPATTATSSDFTSLSGSVTIPAGNSTATFDLPIADDTAFENDEAVVIRLTNVTNANLDNTTNDRFRQLTHTIVNDDSEPAVSFSAGSSTVPDEGTAPSIDVALSTASGNDITVDLTATGGTATGGGTDYELKTTTLTFDAGETSKTLDATDLTITDDDLNETDETVELALQNPSSGASIGSTDQHVLTITDDDPLPEVDFQNATSSASELDGSASITLELRDPVSGNPVASGRDITVSYSVSGTATGGGTDFTDTESGSLTIPVGTQTGAITLTLVDDVEAEGDETVGLSINGLTGAQDGGITDHTFTLLDNDAGSVGPGGVGVSPVLTLWLRAHDLSDAGFSDGSAVATWPDVSGSGRDATQSSAGSQPDLQVNALNERAVLVFDNDHMTLSSGIAATDGTIFAVVNKTGTNTASSYRTLLTTDNHILTSEAANNEDGSVAPDNDPDANEWGGYYSPPTKTHGANETIGSSYRLLSHVVREDGSGAYDSDESYTDGGNEQSFTEGAFSSGLENVVGAGRGFNQNHPGNIAELIHFGVDLNETRRILVENYLSAKYGLSLDTGGGATDVYAGDLGPDGSQGGGDDYDRGVFGVGRLSPSDLHDAAETGGLRFRTTSGLDNDDFLMAGYQDPGNGINTSDGFPNGVNQRMSRVWFVSETDPGGDLSTNVTFDLSKAALNTLAGDPSGYVLLQQSTPGNNSWNLLQDGADGVNGDQITFQGVDLVDRSAITLATRNQVTSPLSGTALTITGAPDNEGSASSGTLGGDAGWRLIGPPVTGATAGDLISDSDTNGSVIEFGLPVGGMFYRWNDTASSGSGPDGAWELVPSAGDSFANGRGYLLFLFDDHGSPDSDPLDPDLTLDVAAGTVPTGNVPVSGLATGAEFHVLANPYNVPFDLTDLREGTETGDGIAAGSDFQTTVQIWDGGATTAEENGSSAGAYVDVTVNTTATESGAGSMASNAGSRGDVVSAWQGFVVERNSTGSGPTQLTFNSVGKTTGTRTIVGSNAASEAAGPVAARLGLKLTVTGADGQQVARDEAASVTFHPNATAGWDAHDASKLTPLASQYAVIGPVGTIRDGTADIKAVESRLYPTETAREVISVPLALQRDGVAEGTATLSADEWTGVPADWEVTLVDTKGTATPEDDETVAWTEGGTYTFSLDAGTAASGASMSGASADAEGRSNTSNEERPSDTSARPHVLRLSLNGPAARTDTMQAASSESPSSGSLSSESSSSGSKRSDSAARPATQGGERAHRFELRIDPSSAPLPVELQEMTVQQSSRRAQLQWSTASETNNAGFYVETQPLAPGDSTTTASAWATLGFVEGAGTTDTPQSYRFETDELSYGAHAFRLRQVDTDGTATATEPVTVEVHLDRAYAVEAPYPNPSRGPVTLPVTVRETQRVQVILYDMLGRRIATVHDGEIRGQDTRSLQLSTDRLASGSYFVRVRGEGFVATERLTIIR